MSTPPTTDRPVLLLHGVGSSFEHNWGRSGWLDLFADQLEAGTEPAEPLARLCLRMARSTGALGCLDVVLPFLAGSTVPAPAG